MYTNKFAGMPGLIPGAGQRPTPGANSLWSWSRPAGAMMPGTMTPEQIAQVNTAQPTNPLYTQNFTQGAPAQAPTPGLADGAMQKTGMGPTLPTPQAGDAQFAQLSAMANQPPMGMMAQRYMSPDALNQWQTQQQAALQARQQAQSDAFSARQPVGGDPAALAALQQRQQYASGAQAQRQALQQAQAARLQAMMQRQGEQVGPKEMARREALIRQMRQQRMALRQNLQANRPGMLVTPAMKPGM